MGRVLGVRDYRTHLRAVSAAAWGYFGVSLGDRCKLRDNVTRTRARMRILVVEDDSVLAAALTRALSQAAYAVDLVEDGELANHALGANSYDLVVLDIALPKIDGLAVLRRLRDRRSQTPVLILTARDTLEDRVNGLDFGADDYLTKPFDLPEFEARVRALIRRGL